MADKQRVVIASRLYTPEVTAASFRMAALVRALDGDAQVIVLTSRPPAAAPADTGSERRGSSTVKRMPVLRDRSGAIRGYLQYLSFDVPLFFRLLVNPSEVIVAEAPPTTGMMSAVVAMLTGRRLIYYPGDVWSDAVKSTGAPRVVVELMRSMERFVLRRATRTIAVSPEVHERLRAVGAQGDRLVEVGNGIDTAVFHPAVPAPSAAKPYFAYTGTMSEWQQPDVFVRALALLAELDIDIRFFGQGAVEAELRQISDSLVPGRVHFHGLVPPDVSASWIRGAVGALVSVVPGIGYDFARPTKTYAAAAVGTPVLFAGASTGAEVVRAADLGVTSAFQVDGVAGAMRTLYEQWQDGTTERERPRRAQWAEESVSWSTVGRRAADVVRSVLQGTSDRRR